MDTTEIIRSEIARRAAKGQLNEAPNGPILPRFDASELASAIEREIERGGIAGYTRVSLHMSMEDAAHLAKFLRR